MNGSCFQGERTMVVAYAHAVSFTLLLILFMMHVVFASLGLNGQKTIHLLCRLTSVFVIFTGAGLVIQYSLFAHLWQWSLIKMLFGLWLIASMELILVRLEKKRRTGVYWAFFCIGIIATFTIGFTFI
ncbi:DUF1516 family protein [Sporolactobacillus sp. THM7-7]|nr:DUF1516 family protein [Sporolactobacillus sp. THM7-7]